MQDTPIDVKPTVLEGELPVIQNEQVKLLHILQVHSQVCNCCSICIKLLWCIQGISEDPSKAITAEVSNNHAENPSDEVVLIFLFFYSQFGAIDPFSRVLTK